MNKSDLEFFRRLLSEAQDDGACAVDELQTTDGDVVFVLDADNGKSHGQSGHKKASVYFVFNQLGTLSRIDVRVPSIQTKFTALE